MPAFGLLDTWEGAARRGLVEPRADERGASPGTSSSSSARRSTGRACWSRAPPAPENRPSSCASPRRAAATTLSSSSICSVIFPRSSVTSKRSRASTRGRWPSSPASRWSARRRSSCRTRSRKSTSDGRHRPVRAALPAGQRRSDHLGGREPTLDGGSVRPRSRERNLENIERLDPYGAHPAAPSGPGGTLLGSRRKTRQMRSNSLNYAKAVDFRPPEKIRTRTRSLRPRGCGRGSRSKGLPGARPRTPWCAPGIHGDPIRGSATIREVELLRARDERSGRALVARC